MNKLARYGIFPGKLGEEVRSEFTGKRMIIMQIYPDGAQHLSEIPEGMTLQDYGHKFSGTLLHMDDCQ